MIKEIFKFSIRRLIQTKINGGIVLLFVALAAMLIANSPLQEYYNILLSKNITLTIGSFNLFDRHDGNPMTLLDFINDALMAIFFFSVGLEIKRELLVGELSSPRKALLPVVAACGGMIIPVLFFWLISPSGPAGSCHTHGNGHRFFPRRSLTPRQESPLESENIPHRLCRRG